MDVWLCFTQRFFHSGPTIGHMVAPFIHILRAPVLDFSEFEHPQLETRGSILHMLYNK